MSATIQNNVALSHYSTLGVGGVVRYFSHIHTEHDIETLHQFAQDHSLPCIMIGSGSNTLFNDGILNACIGHIQILDREITKEEKDSVTVSIGAGESWDDIVAWSTENNWSGLEALSAIPGTVGAAPVQNIGAYGSEIQNVLLYVRAYDSHTRQWVTFNTTQCRFGYRSSLFKQSPNRYSISAVTLRLSKQPPALPDYPRILETYHELLKERHLPFDTEPTPSHIRETIIRIRSEKLPDPHHTKNAGSFFKNPIVPEALVESLRKKFPNMPTFPSAAGTKVPAGWLIETAGLKGYTQGNVGTYHNNALVLVNHGEATAQEIMTFANFIQDKIKTLFSIELEMEVRCY